MQTFVTLLSLLLPAIFPAPVQSVDTIVAAAMQAHGSQSVEAAQTIVIRGSSTSGEITQAITITAAMDGRLRLDYGDPPSRSIVTTNAGQFEIVDGSYRPKPAHAGLYAQLDLLSILGARHLALFGVHMASLRAGA